MKSKHTVSFELVRNRVRQLERRMMNGEHAPGAIADSIERIYAKIELPKPVIVWCESPAELTNFPWVLTVLLQCDQATWRADLIKSLTPVFRNNNAGSPQRFWQRVQQSMHEGSHRKNLGPLLNSRFTELLMRKISPALGEQSEKLVDSATKLAIDHELRATILRLIEGLRSACEPMAATPMIPGMRYSPAIYAPPGKNWVDDNAEMLNASLRPTSVFADVWGPSTLYWLITYDCIRASSKKPVYDDDLNRQLSDWIQLLDNGHFYVFFEHFCFVCAYPAKLVVDENMRLHNANGPAMRFGDGRKYYFWHGNPIGAELIESRKFLAPWLIDLEPNVERRRIMLEIYGFEKYLRKARAKKLHQDECGILYRADLRGDEPIVAVEVVNSTPEPDGVHKRYLLRVPPHISTAREAVAWTFGMRTADYKPSVQT